LPRRAIQCQPNSLKSGCVSTLPHFENTDSKYSVFLSSTFYT
jgi:hypothetical protein